MGVLRQVSRYFYLTKRKSGEPHSSWIGYMHGINRISIFMFLFAIIVMIVRAIIHKH